MPKLAREREAIEMNGPSVRTAFALLPGEGLPRRKTRKRMVNHIAIYS